MGATVGTGSTGTTAASSDIVLAKDPDNYTKICDGKIAGANIIAPWIVTKTFWDADPKAAAAFVEAAFRANEYINATDPGKAVEHVPEYYNDTGIEGDAEKAAYAMEMRDWVTLEEAIGDVKSGLTNDPLTGAAEILVQSGARDSVPDFGQMQPLALEILEAAKAMR